MHNLFKFRLVLLVSLVLCFYCQTVFGFTDISDDFWAMPAIREMENRNIFHGYPDGSFQPNNNVTREEFAKIVVATLNLTKKDNVLKYEDIEDDRWSKEYIDIAGKYFTAFSNGRSYYFMPTEHSLREDVVVTMVYALQLENSEYDLSILDKFKDKDSISPNLMKYMAIGIENGLIAGYPDATIKAQGKLTRAEVAQFMYNILLELDKGKFVKFALGDLEKQEPSIERIQVPGGQVKKFARKLENGKSFKIVVNNITVEGKMEKNGELFELYPYFDGARFLEQFLVNELIGSRSTMYGAEEDAKLYGFQLTKYADKVTFSYEIDNKIYFADSEVYKNHVETDVLQNFICFILNNDKKVQLELFDDSDEQLLDFESIIDFYDESYEGTARASYPYPNPMYFETKVPIKNVDIKMTNRSGVIVALKKNQTPNSGIWVASATKPGEKYDVTFSNIIDGEGNKYKDFHYSFETPGNPVRDMNKEFDVKWNIERDNDGILKNVDIELTGDVKDAEFVEIIAHTNANLDAYMELSFTKEELLRMLKTVYHNGDKIMIDVRLISYANGVEKTVKVISKDLYIEETTGVISSDKLKIQDLISNYDDTYSGKAEPSYPFIRMIHFSTKINIKKYNATLMNGNNIIVKKSVNELESGLHLPARLDPGENYVVKFTDIVDENDKKYETLMYSFKVSGTKLVKTGEDFKVDWNLLLPKRIDLTLEGELKPSEVIFHDIKNLRNNLEWRIDMTQIDIDSLIKEYSPKIKAGDKLLLSVYKYDFATNSTMSLLAEKTVTLPEEVPASTVSLGMSNISISLAKSYTFNAKVTPSNAQITWASSDESIATIDQNGVLIPRGVGKTVVSATASNGKTAKCDVTIYTLKYSSTTMDVGNTECIVHGAEKLHDFQSSNKSIAKVDQKGNVSAIGAGVATISMKDMNDTVVECVITVKDENLVLAPISFKISPEKDEYTLNDVITASVKKGVLQGSEAIIWEFEIDGQEIATNSGYNMKVSKIVDIAKYRYKGDIYGKDITLKLFPRDVRNNTDREITTFTFKIVK